MTTQTQVQLKLAIESQSPRLNKNKSWKSINGFKRTRMEIFAEILLFCARQRAKTNIMYKINLNYAQLQTHLSYLTRQGLLLHEGNMYVTTEKGFRFLELFADLQGTLMNQKT